jgi:hypothetical protein
MANGKWTVGSYPDQTLYQIRLVDNGDGTYSLATYANATPVAGTGFEVNDVASPTSVLTYAGKTDASGAWCVMKVDTTSGTSVRYATVTNNATVTSYAAAWAARATLTYDTWDVAF